MEAKAFEITQAARAGGVSLDTLRNWLRRDVLKYKGDEPRPSYPRMFSLAGVYEIALLRELMEGGLDRDSARALVQNQLDQWQESDGAVVARLNQLDGGQRTIPPMRRKRPGIVLEHRDQSAPMIWVFSFSDSGGANLPIPHVKYAKGYADVPAQIAALQKEGKPYLLKANEPNPAKPGAPYPFVSTLNVTAILARVDELLEAE